TRRSARHRGGWIADRHDRRPHAGTLSWAFLAYPGRVDVAIGVDGERRDFLLGRAVKNERLARGSDPVQKATAVRAGNQVAFGIDREHANVRFVALEEHGVVTLGRYFENLAVIARRHKQVARVVERQI